VLSAGDVIVSVEGRATAGLPLGDVANAIRGELGTDVTLVVRRGGAGEPERVVVRRDRVSMPERRPRGRGPHGDPHGDPHVR
jgi:carboxyl-terminal processing protease